MQSISEARTHMEKAVDAMRREFSSVRTGKASPALLETVKVEAYGSKMPISQVATVTAPEPRLLMVQPWDKSLMQAIEKAIQTSDLGLNPANDGNLIRVPIPQLPEDRRTEMVKGLHKLAEEDPCFHVEHNPELNETVIRGLGEMHLRVMLERMKERYGVEVKSRPPRIAYRESMSG